MKIAHELRERTAAFVDGRMSLPDLQLWLAEHIQAIADADDPHMTEWSDRAWILIGELLDGLRDEPSVRADLEEFLAPRAFPGARPALTPNP
jgi:hypothetical protein